MWVVGATLTSARFRIVVGHKRGGGKTPETVAQKRREHFIKGKASKEIARDLKLSRNAGLNDRGEERKKLWVIESVRGTRTMTQSRQCRYARLY